MSAVWCLPGSARLGTAWLPGPLQCALWVAPRELLTRPEQPLLLTHMLICSSSDHTKQAKAHAMLLAPVQQYAGAKHLWQVSQGNSTLPCGIKLTSHACR